MGQDNRQVEESARQGVLTLSLVTTFCSLIPTIYASVISNSAALFTDALRCSVEFLAIAITWLIARHISKESFRIYNYGFGKLEHLCSLAVACAMLAAFAVASFSAFMRLLNPQVVVNSGFGLLLSILSVAGNFFVWRRNVSVNLVAPSPIVASQTRLFLSKTLASLVVFVALLASSLSGATPWVQYLDPLGSIILAGFLLYSSYSLAFRSLNEILDRSLEEHFQLVILRILVKHDKDYRSLRKIRSRRAGDKSYVELFLGFDKGLVFQVVQESMTRIKNDLQAEIDKSEIIVIPVAE